MVIAYNESHANSDNCCDFLLDFCGERRHSCHGCKWANGGKGKNPTYCYRMGYQLVEWGANGHTVILPGQKGKAPRSKQGTFRELGFEDMNCGKFGLIKECESCGSLIAKRLVCGREWCPTCGQDHSEAHQRKISHLIDRVFSMPIVGYFVFEVPLSLRSNFKNVELLRESRRYLHRLLRREGFAKGVSRWHYYGEAEVNELSMGYNELVNEIQLGKYHPHLNVLVERVGKGKLPLAVIQRIRKLWTEWLEWRFGVQLGYVAPVHFEFRMTPGKIYHLVEYLTRSTFKKLTQENWSLAEGLFEFKNVSWFGKFTEQDKERGHKRFEDWIQYLEAKGKLKNRNRLIDTAAWELYETGLCPVCGGNTKVLQVDKVSNYRVIVDYGGGLMLVEESQGP